MIKHGGDIYSYKEAYGVFPLDYSSNINPLGIPKCIKKAIIKNIDSVINYPDTLSRNVRECISKKENIMPDYIYASAGAADVLYRLALSVKPKKTLIAQPTFLEYEHSISIIGAEVSYYSMKEGLSFSLDDGICENIKDDIDIVYICNPNNPSGNAAKKEVVKSVIERCAETKTILVIDECFMDFVFEEERYSAKEYIEKYENIVLLKAFTKIYALPGIRLGYALSSNKCLIESLYEMGQSWALTTLSECIANAALKEKSYIDKTKIFVQQERQRLMNAIKEIGFTVCDSLTNYIMFKTELDMKTMLEKEGVLIRSCENYKTLDKTYFRIAVKDKKSNDIFIKRLRKIINSI